MEMFWLQPLAWWGLAAVAIPILIHLLVLQHSRRVLFPSLRFLRATRLAAVRRHVVSDWPLLTLRLLILAAAVAALAAPVFVSGARWQSWNTRVARAVVVLSSGDEVAPLVEEERAGTFASAVFTPTAAPADGLRDASDWLQRQPPAAREIVIVGDFRAGSLNGRDFDSSAPSTGVRLLPVVSGDRRRTTTLVAIAEPPSATGAAPMLLHVTPTDDATTVSRGSGEEVAPARQQAEQIRGSLPVEVRAAPDDQAAADAALRAVLADGLMLHRQTDRRVVIDFAGAPGSSSAIAQPATGLWMREALERLPEVRGGERDGALVVQAGIRGADAHAVQLIARVVRHAFADDLRDLEPRLIPASTLAAWSRPPRAVPDDVRPGDEGDRRVLWAAALALLALEHVLRRSRASASAENADRDGAEARVA
jgi:hypothetical protein